MIKTTEHEEFQKKTKLDDKSREGFWRYTSERFLYLNDFINQFQLNNVFHLEYDNMLYVDLEELLPIFENKYSGIGATFDNDQDVFRALSILQILMPCRGWQSVLPIMLIKI